MNSKCRSCGNVVDSGVNFCSHCGIPTEAWSSAQSVITRINENAYLALMFIMMAVVGLPGIFRIIQEFWKF